MTVVNADSIVSGIDFSSDVYFVHSYFAPVGANTIATCNYGCEFSAIVRRNNFYGMQFHPEKSGKVGLNLIQNFLGVVNDSLSCY
jgi:glutamine amidotransferase